MGFIDFLWTIGWFLVGLAVFQFPPAKKLFTYFSSIISILSLVALFAEPDALTKVFVSLGLSYISGILTTLSYLIGANIGRYLKFKRLSPRIVIYIILFLGLLYVINKIVLK